ncbi:hypothetical protein [Natronococcus sp. A-GB7]|uniref:hypothetical protein n=1 Tax=Natronococcus sp. A-GB7 TaxID=3037649 RepID=UPI00241C67A4|nr:hypothetical protein [Natronococcus sp. A-GB7]MDG5821292.1 hypothetical protein [Natronococcus sp. A-GB7]
MHNTRWESVGSVRSGDWDQKTPSDRSEWLNDLLFADRFEDSVFHQSFEEHYQNGSPWSETELVQTIKQNVSEDDPYHSCTTVAEVDQFFESVDEVHQSIILNGYQTQKHLQKTAEGRPYAKFKSRVRDEICIDIGRSGEPLFVDGKHRLSLAKILDLEEIPVVILVRHSKWADEVN